MPSYSNQFPVSTCHLRWNRQSIKNLHSSVYLVFLLSGSDQQGAIDTMTTNGDGNLFFAMYGKEQGDDGHQNDMDVDMTMEDDDLATDALKQLEAGITQFSTPARQEDVARQVRKGDLFV